MRMTRTAQRLKASISEVLAHIPPEDAALINSRLSEIHIYDSDPNQVGWIGCAFLKEDGTYRVEFIQDKLRYNRHMVSIVAHELAHVLRGFDYPSIYETEKAANDQVRAWGIPAPFYPVAPDKNNPYDMRAV